MTHGHQLTHAAFIGLLSGLTSLASPDRDPPDLIRGQAAAEPMGEKDGCKGKDGCKSKDGCKGKDSCSGKSEKHS